MANVIMAQSQPPTPFLCASSQITNEDEAVNYGLCEDITSAHDTEQNRTKPR